MSYNVIASALQGTRLVYFAQIIQDLFYHIDMSPAMVYLIDICDDSALNALSKQFGVDGLKGMDFCETTEAKRTLLKNAITMQKYIGTVYGIRMACELTGYSFTRIDTNVDIDGKKVWCAFNVIIGMDGLKSSTTSQLQNLKFLIKQYKAKRDIFCNIGFEEVMNDTVSFSEELIIK